VAAVIPDADPLSSGATSPINRDCPRGFDRFIKNTLMVYSEPARPKVGDEGIATMKTVDEAWETTMALTRPSLLASLGARRTAPDVSRLDMPRRGPLTTSLTP